MWLELAVPVPPRLTELCGYPGDARYVGLCWQPCGDEVEYDDGQLSGTGSWAPYLAYVQHRAVAMALLPYDFGNSDAEAKHLLLIDRTEQKAFVADVRTGREFLRRQSHPQLPESDLGDTITSLADLLDLSKLQQMPIDQVAVEARMREEAQQTEEMIRYLDSFIDR
jgi:hypothetical protein